jgi:hypothetical protein
MKRMTTLFLAALLTTGALYASIAVAAPPAPVKLPDLEFLSKKASESVTISLDPNTLGIAAGFLDPHDPEDAAAKELIKGLKGIYVRNFTFDDEDDFVSDVQLQNALSSLRSLLKEPDWQQLLAVRNSREQTSSEIYLSVDQGHTNGLVIIDSQPREFTIVNIVGDIDLEKLHRLEGRFGIPKLSAGDALTHCR